MERTSWLRRIWLFAAVIGVLSLFAGTAFAYFKSAGSGTGTVSTGTLAAPTNQTATAASPNITVSWTASSLSNGTTSAQNYTVERYNSSGTDLSAASCGIITGGTSGTFQCADSPAAGTYKYKVTAIYDSWTATTAFTTAISVGPPATTSAISGSGQSALVNAAFTSPLVAKVTDTSNNPVSGVAVTFAAPSSGASANFASSGCSNGGGSTCVVTTGSNGTATSSAFTANGTVDSSYTITAQGSGTAATGFSETNTAGSSLTAVASSDWQIASTWGGLTGSGTITAATNSAAVTGSGTAFTTQLAVGERLLKSDQTTSIGVITSITDNTHLTLTTVASVAVTNANFGYGRVPTVSDSVTIPDGKAVTVASGESAQAGSVAANLTANTFTAVALSASSSSLNVANDFTMTDTVTGKVLTANVGAGSLAVGRNLNLSTGTGTDSGRDNVLSISTGTVTVAGNLVFNSSNVASPNAAGYQVLFSGAGTLNIAGSFTANGSAGTLTPGTGTVNFDGTAAQTIPIVSNINYANINTNNSAGATVSGSISTTSGTGRFTTSTSSTSVVGATGGNATHFTTQLAVGDSLFTTGGAIIGTIASISSDTALTLTTNAATNNNNNITFAYVSTTIIVQGGTFSNGGSTLDIGTFRVAAGAVANLTGTSSMPLGGVSLDPNSTVNYTGTNQAVSSQVYGNLGLSGSGTKTAGGALTVQGDLTIGSNTIFAASTFSHTLEGNFTNNGTFTAATSTVTFAGSSAETIGGTASTSFNNLTLSNAANAVSLSGVNLTVTGTLALGTNILTTGSGAAIAGSTSVTRTAGTSGFVNGNLELTFTTGSKTNVPFPVGTGTTYSPVTLASVVVTTAGSLTASSTAGLETNFSTSGLSQTKYVNRYWTLTASGGVAVSSYTAQFTFVAGDLIGSPTISTLKVSRDVSGTWTAGASPAPTGTTVTGTWSTNVFGNYASGD